jgi:nucleoside-specific outer membrane channel protein Tsx
MKTTCTIAFILTALIVGLSAESVNPATKPQTAPMTAQEKKNLETVMAWWRDVLYAGHFELAPKYQAETYIQHNPNVNTGRAGFIEFFTKLGRKPMTPIPAAMPVDQQPVVWR